eukprot:5369894-Lingulodinium_polyedra.AAC.1
MNDTNYDYARAVSVEFSGAFVVHVRYCAYARMRVHFRGLFVCLRVQRRNITSRRVTRDARRVTRDA